MLAASLALIGLSLPAAAAPKWTFWAGPMAQYEGGLELSKDLRIGYSCTDFSSSFNITVPGQYAGKAAIYIDGKKFRNTIMNKSKDGTSYSAMYVRDEDSKNAKKNYNTLIDAISAGGEASLRSADGKTVYGSFPLKGSSEAEICKFD